MSTRTEAPPSNGLGRGTLLGVGLALLSTGIAYVVGMGGAPVRVVTGWSPDGADLTLAETWVSAAVAVMAGSFLLARWTRRQPGAWRGRLAVVAAIAITSAVPLWRLDVDTGSKVTLTTMHLLTGASAALGHAIPRRRGSPR